MPETSDQDRARDRAYQSWAAEMERKRRERERQGENPEEAGFRLLAEMGDFHSHYRSTLRHD